MTLNTHVIDAGKFCPAAPRRLQFPTMSEIVRCPDCGGIVGATEATDEGPPCGCFGQPGYKSDPADPSNTQVMSSPTQQKICCMCGKDSHRPQAAQRQHGILVPRVPRRRPEEKRSAWREVRAVRPHRAGAALTSADGQRDLHCAAFAKSASFAGRAASDTARSAIRHIRRRKAKIIILAVVVAILGILAIIAWQRRPWKNSRGPAAHQAVYASASGAATCSRSGESRSSTSINRKSQLTIVSGASGASDLHDSSRRSRTGLVLW